MSDEKVKQFAHKLGLVGDVYRIDGFSEASRRTFKPIGFSFPDVLVFNSEGQQIHIDINCSSDLITIASLPVDAIDTFKTKPYTLPELTHDIYIPEPPALHPLNFLSKPLYVVKFAEFAGKLNKQFVPDIVKILKSRNEVAFIMLNMDYSMDDSGDQKYAGTKRPE